MIHSGSATDSILAALREKPRTVFTESDLIAATGRSHGAISWSLAYLRSQGLVEVLPDPRSDRYQRYRLCRPTTTPE